jgi:formate dehydrogenase maturation protein FdhE
MLRIAFGVCVKCYTWAIFKGPPGVEDSRIMSVRSRQQVKCPSCESSDVVTISMSFEGSGIEFRACHACEERWWEKDGARIPLKVVLDLVPKR